MISKASNAFKSRTHQPLRGELKKCNKALKKYQKVLSALGISHTNKLD